MKRIGLGLAAALLSAQAVLAADLGADGYAYHTIPGVSPEPIVEGAGLKSAQELEAFFDGMMLVELKAQHAAGATVSVVKDGKLYFTKGYGFADVDKRVPVDPAVTLFRPGSTSKLFTWTSVMQLVEQGKLDLDADVNTYLTQFKIPATFAQPVTLRNLLTHTPGFEDGGIGYLFVHGADELVPLAEHLGKHMPARVRPPTVDFTHGENASYSNWGACLAGLIVSNVSGMSYDDYVEKNIFTPLGMTHSTFREPLPAALAADLSGGYSYKAGVYKNNGFEWGHNIEPAGTLFTTATDMARFMIAHLNNGAAGNGSDARILKTETAQLMHSRVFSPSPYLNGSGLGFYEIYSNGRRLIAHNGATLHFHTNMFLLPEEKFGVFISWNSDSGAPTHGPVLQAFMDHYYPARLPVLTPPKDFAQRAGEYVGSYRANRRSFTKNEAVLSLLGGIKVSATAKNTLMISGMGPEPSQWVEVAPHTLREMNSGTFIAFTRGDDGRRHIIGPSAFGAAYELAWYETSALHFLILGLALLAFVVAIVSAWRRWSEDARNATPQRYARRVAALVGVLNLAFVLALVIAFTGDSGALLLGFPAIFHEALVLPLMVLPLMLIVTVFAVMALARGWWSRGARVQYAVIALLSLAFIWSLNFWNLVGYKFG